MKLESINKESTNSELNSQIFNIEAEKAIIGALLVNNENYLKVSSIVAAENFYVPLHQKIYKIIEDFVAKDLTATPISIKSYLNTGESNDNYEYLLDIYKNAAIVSGIETYAKEVYECFVRRRLIDIADSVIHEANEVKYNTAVKDIIEAFEQKLFNLSQDKEGKTGGVMLREGINSLLNHLAEMRKGNVKSYGVTTGLDDLDRILGGLQSSDLIILAARPSMGKTSLAINIALNAAKALKDKNQAVAFFSLEMSTEQIATRMLSINSGFSSSRIRAAEFDNKDDFEKLCLVARDLNELPVYVDDTPAITISSLKSKARRLKKQHGIGLIVVDYLQLMRGSSSGENRVQEIGEISQGLKAIAKELNIPVIALSQLSRAVESRDDKRPQLSDLRESGNIEQDADVVMFIYRDEYYHLRKEPAVNDPAHEEWANELNRIKNIADVIISKQRNGAIGVVQLFFNAHTTNFTNLAK